MSGKYEFPCCDRFHVCAKSGKFLFLRSSLTGQRHWLLLITGMRHWWILAECGTFKGSCSCYLGWNILWPTVPLSSSLHNSVVYGVVSLSF